MLITLLPDGPNPDILKRGNNNLPPNPHTGLDYRLALVNQLTFGWEAYAFKLEEKALPPALMFFNLTGNKLVSLPHSSYGGYELPPAWRKENILHEIFRQLKETHKIPFDQWELRGFYELSTYRDEKKITSILPLNSEGQLWDSLGTNLRRKIKKAAASGLTLRVGGYELLDDFYQIYQRHMHKIGGFPLPYDYLYHFLNILEHHATLFMLYKDGQIAGGSLTHRFKGFVENTLFVPVSSYQKYYVSDYLHWQMIRHALSKNADLYSFGRSTRESSVFHYKSHWPVDHVPLYWNYSQNQNFNPRYFHLLKKTIPFIPGPVHKSISGWVTKKIY